MPQLQTIQNLRLKLFYIFSTLLFAAISLSYVFYGNYDPNEGWYYYDAYVTKMGAIIYKDFFYHRLPLYIKICSAIPINLNFINSRLSSFATINLLFFAFLIQIRKFKFEIQYLITILFIVNLEGIYLYNTIQSYSIIGLLLFLAVIFCKDNSPTIIKTWGVAFLLILTHWMRYPIDYIPIAFIVYLITNFKGKRFWIVSTVFIYLTGHYILFKLYDSPTFRYDVWLGMFQDYSTNLSSIEKIRKLIHYKLEWIYPGIFYFLPTLYICVYVIGLFENKITIKNLICYFFKLKSWEQLSLLFIFGNFAMYAIAKEGHIVQMYFVFPLILLFLAERLNKHASQINSHVFYKLIMATAISLILIDSNYKFLNSDPQTIKEVGEFISKKTQISSKILTFTPVYAAEAKRQLLSGFEFETYAYFEKLPTDLALKMHLLNKEIITNYLLSKQANLLALDDRFYKREGNSARLKSIQPTINNIINENYHRIFYDRNLNINLLRGNLEFYIP